MVIWLGAFGGLWSAAPSELFLQSPLDTPQKWHYTLDLNLPLSPVHVASMVLAILNNAIAVGQLALHLPLQYFAFKISMPEDALIMVWMSAGDQLCKDWWLEAPGCKFPSWILQNHLVVLPIFLFLGYTTTVTLVYTTFRPTFMSGLCCIFGFSDLLKSVKNKNIYIYQRYPIPSPSTSLSKHEEENFRDTFMHANSAVHSAKIKAIHFLHLHTSN